MVEKFKKITEEMVELYEKKNSDYGDSVHQTYEKYGPVSFLVRMEDKINRVKTLTEKDYESRVNDERVRDSLIDLANYAIIMITEMERDKITEVTTYFNELVISPNETSISNLTFDDNNNQWCFLTEKNED